MCDESLAIAHASVGPVPCTLSNENPLGTSMLDHFVGTGAASKPVSLASIGGASVDGAESRRGWPSVERPESIVAGASLSLDAHADVTNDKATTTEKKERKESMELQTERARSASRVASLPSEGA